MNRLRSLNLLCLIFLACVVFFGSGLRAAVPITDFSQSNNSPLGSVDALVNGFTKFIGDLGNDDLSQLHRGKTRILLPPGYAEEKTPLPVVILLHGIRGPQFFKPSTLI